MPHPSPLLSPRDHHLDESVAILATREDYPNVVRIVEAWAAQGIPTPRALLSQARAFFHLRLMDRALERTRQVLEADPDHVRGLLLQVEIFLERGWPIKARKPLLQLRSLVPSGPVRAEVDDFWARALAEPIGLDAQAREIERQGDPAQLLQLAEHFLATGSFVRATGILERLHRTQPDNTQVRDLLWGLAGDFGGGAPSVDALVASLIPPDSNALPRENTLEEPETESHALEDSDPDLESTGSPSFPVLFKQAPSDPPAAPPADSPPDERNDATQATALASAGDMLGSDETEATDPGLQMHQKLPSTDSNDTQIVLVLLNKGEKPPNQLHRKREGEEDGGLRETLNLRAWQASMGVSRTSDLSETQDHLFDRDDESVVVMNPGGPPPDTPRREAAAVFQKPIEVIEKHPTPIAPEKVDPAYLYDEPPPPPPPRVWPRALLLGTAALAAAATLIAVVFIGNLSAGSGSNGIRGELVRALAAEDYNTLLLQETRLEQLASAAPPSNTVAAARAALSETQLILWSAYNGDPTRITRVRDTLENPAALDVHRLAILRAGEALARQDNAGASAALGRERPEDDEERLLFGRIAARGGDLERALQHFDAIEHSEQPRYGLARAEVLAAAGRREEARTLVSSVLEGAPDHAAARILALELDEAAPAATVSAVDEFLENPTGTDLAPRLEGRLQALRARAFLALGSTAEATTAVQRGLSRDGTNPDLLFLHAAQLTATQQLTAAAQDLKSVVTARPGASEAQAAYVLLLLDLDRVREANDVVTQLESASMLGNLTPVLGTLVSVWGNQEPPRVQLLPPQAATTLGAYAAALLAVQERSTEALAALQAAISATGASHDPFERRLAPRLITMQALVAGAPAGDAYVTAALAAHAHDPAVHVFAGRYFETADRKALAALHFDRAVQLGPELGLAWYESGRFYLDAQDGFARSGAAWRSFLALAPSGPRASRAQDSLGVR